MDNSVTKGSRRGLSHAARAAYNPGRSNMCPSPSKVRRERERQEVRNLILDAARELFARHGYEAVTMRKIAEQIEYTPTAIYSHFADKETLVREIVAHDFAAFAQEFRRCADIADPWERLLSIGRVFVAFGTRHPNHYRLMFMTPPSGIEEADYSSSPGDPTRDVYAFFKSCIEEAIARGCFRAELDDAELLVQALWSGMHGVVSLYIAKGADHWIKWRGRDLIAATMMDLFVRGLRRAER